MRIAVACEGLAVAPRLEHCESYMCYSVNHGVIVDGQNMPTLGVVYQEIAKTLHELGVCVLIVGAIDSSVAKLFCDANIELVAGARGNARQLVEHYLTDTLIGVDELCGDEDEDEDFGVLHSECGID